MLRRMLVPLDGSEVAESVLAHALVFAKLVGAEVTLVQAAAAVKEAAGVVPEVDTAKAVEKAHAYLVETARTVKTADVVVHTKVLEGAPVEAILSLAGDYDVVAMATHGRSGIGRWVFGSVADRVVQAAPVPVLLYRASEAKLPPAAPKHLLVPLDGSELAEQAVPLAIDLAARAGAAVTLVQSIYWVQAAIADPLGYGAGVGAAGLIDETEDAAKTYLQGVADRFAARGVTCSLMVRFEPAADAVLSVSAEVGADLVVMCTHGRGGLGRWMLGSVADRVLRGANVPVLLVRAKASA